MGLSSAEIERAFPYLSKVILRTPWRTHEQLAVNQRLTQLTNDYHRWHFNGISTYRFPRQETAASFTDFVRIGRYHRLKRDCHDGAGQTEIALEWLRLCDERQSILAWGRQDGRLQSVVQAYRFARRCGDHADKAYADAGDAVRRLDPSVAEPMNHAAVLLEWAEREHRAWFWRCCRDHHVL